MSEQRFEFADIGLIDVKPDQTLAEQVVVRETLQAQQIQALGLFALPFVKGQRAAYCQHLRLLIGVRVLLGLFEQCNDLWPVLQLLRLLQGFDQTLRIFAMLPTGNHQCQSTLRISGAIQGDQLAFVATG